MISIFDALGPEFCAPDVSAALVVLAGESVLARGAVFTRPEVAVAILDLCGYTADRALHRLRRLELSFGGGDFCCWRRSACWRSGVARAARLPRLADAAGGLPGVEFAGESAGAALQSL
jgi:hypothetical protein